MCKKDCTREHAPGQAKNAGNIAPSPIPEEASASPSSGASPGGVIFRNLEESSICFSGKNPLSFTFFRYSDLPYAGEKK